MKVDESKKKKIYIFLMLYHLIKCHPHILRNHYYDVDVFLISIILMCLPLS